MMFFVLLSVKQKFGDKELDSESDSSSSESEDDDARVSLGCLFGFHMPAASTDLACGEPQT